MNGENLPTAILAEPDPERRELLAGSLAGLVRIVALPDDGLDAVLAAAEHKPDLAVLDLELPVLGGLEASRQALDKSPGTGIILTVPRRDTEVVLSAMEIGIQDVVVRPATAESLRASADHWLRRGERLATWLGAAVRKPSQGTWAFCGPKGGEGRTSLVVAAAWELHRRGERVLLVDLDRIYGDVTFYLGLPDAPLGPGLAGLDPKDATPQLLQRLIVTHPCGVPVFLGFERDRGLMLQPEDVVWMIERLESMFTYVLLDMPVGMPEALMPVLDRSRRVFLVTSAEAAHLRALRVLHNVLRSCGYSPSKLAAVVSHSSDRMVVEQFCENSGIRLLTTLPDSRDVVDRAVRAGLPIPVVEPEGAYARAVSALVGTVLAPGG